MAEPNIHPGTHNPVASIEVPSEATFWTHPETGRSMITVKSGRDGWRLNTEATPEHIAAYRDQWLRFIRGEAQ